VSSLSLKSATSADPAFGAEPDASVVRAGWCHSRVSA
jgi:hypothetical protein